MRTSRPFKCCHCKPGVPCLSHATKAHTEAWYDKKPLGDGSYTLVKRDRPRLALVPRA